MEKLVHEFIQYCFDNGSFLKRDILFHKMANELLSAAIGHDIRKKESIIPERIISGECKSEMFVAVRPEINFRAMSDKSMLEALPAFVLVYRYERQIGANEFVYVFEGGRAK
jgi:hypothetical protein